MAGCDGCLPDRLPRRLLLVRQLGPLDVAELVVDAIRACIETPLGPDFEPQRFIGRTYSRYEYLPFGGGRRRCIGAALASYEMRMVLATLLRRRRIRRAPGFGSKATRRGVTLTPKGGAPVIFEAL